MKESQKSLVLATVPVLRESGVALTTYFYQRMLKHNPELKNVFNQSHQKTGNQPQALAMAVLAYAENINDPSVLLSVVERIAHKHTSLGIRAEQYGIVGKHLLASIKEVLGDAASDELIDAWAAAYQQLADLFIDVESKLYQASVEKAQGWTGWRPFRVRSKVAESEEITSFYLEPTDGGTLPVFKPGQYISVRVFVKETGLYQPRQYSLSQAPNEETLRISIKKESAAEHKPAGLVSNHMHGEIQQGDVIEVSAPYGEFVLNEQSERPIVLLSGGVGITPMMAMSSYLNKKDALGSVHFIHSARNPQVHAFKSVTDEFAEKGMKVNYFYDHGANQDNGVQQAPVELAQVLPKDVTQADYYLCGPMAFMSHYMTQLRQLGVPETQIYAEAFGSGGVA
ncbi:NO-inducible flavohemoprotein [Vibrio sp. A1-b2]|uniref:NO-inducible flavohemoprotein n=1 Tax=Vibrio sp. A1-b2 TaxID=2912248 RepID=UPI001EFFD516|nr:NO-inducible flavohemoprotein [Vibrio sp. A1-b2]MCF7362278.1 NO-inducible flavohemoprotein [Vibrio sp. A1-b2]